MKYTKYECLEAARKYKTEGNFINNFREISNYAKEMGWYQEIINHMTPTRGVKRTKDECSEIAQKYNNIADFKKLDYNIYCYSRNHGWLKEICNHMTRLKNKKTEEECKQEALKYSRRVDFANGSPNYYYYALGNKWFESICNHMIYDYPPMNTVYMWKIKGKNVWKFGICNTKRLIFRINEVSYSKNYEVEKIFYKISEDCRKIEKQLLKLGSKYIDDELKSKFGGDTEFRELTQEELQIALKYF